MIVTGIVILLIGLLLGIPILYTLGIVLIIVGAILTVLGSDRPRRWSPPPLLVKGVAAAAALVAVITGCAAGASAAKDVTLTGCQSSPSGGHPVATGRIDNHSGKSSAYAISVTFADAAGNRVSEGGAAVAKVGSGATATWHATGVATAKGPLHCTVANVTRTVAP